MNTSGMSETGIFDSRDLEKISGAVEAVCFEMGVPREDQIGRQRVATHVMHSWAIGQRTPLGLVQAGLSSFR